MKKIIVIVISLIIIALIVLRLSANYKKINANKDVSTDLTYVSVSVAEVKNMSLSDTLQLTGYMEAYTDVDVSAESAGIITVLNAEEGDNKTKGSTIANTDDKAKKLALEKAENTKEKLEKDLERSKNLFNGGGITEQQLETAQNTFDEAVILLQQAQQELDKTSIEVPISGVITKKYVEKGEFVNIGSPIVKIIDISQLKIVLDVSEYNVYKLKVGDLTQITTDIYPDEKFEGKITYISPQGNEAHSYPVEITISNSSKFPLKAGTFANVIIGLPESEKALYIPRESLLGSISDAEVYVAENNKSILKKIVVKSGNDNYVKVISGLSEGDKVIVNGKINLSDNKEIKIID